MSKFLQTSRFKWIDPKEFDLNKYTSNSSKGRVLEVDLEYPKELGELHDDYPLAPDKIEIKREMWSNNKLKIADHYNIPISNVKKLVPNFFDTEKYVIHYENLKLYLRLRLKLKTIHHILEFNQSQWLKQYVDFSTEKRIEAEKNGDKDGKALYKLMKNSVYGKTMENLRNRIDVRLMSNKKDYLKWTPKPSYLSHKIFDNDLVAIRKNKVTLTLSKAAYIGMCILELSKVSTYEFHFDYIKNKYGNNSRLLLTDTDSLMYEIKPKDVHEDFSNNKEMLDFSNYSTKSKYYDNSNKLVIGKMKDERAGVAIKEFVALNSKMYSYLVDDKSEHKKAKGVNRNVVATISHNEYKDVLLNKKCLSIR